MKKNLVSLAVLVAVVVAGCGDDSEPEQEAGESASASTSSTPDAPTSTSTAPSAEPSSEPTTAAAVIKLPEACKKFAAEWIGDVTKKAYRADGALAQAIADAGDRIVVSAFQPVATIAASAAETIGTIDYIDDEEAYDTEIVKLNGACKLVGSPIFSE